MITVGSLFSGIGGLDLGLEMTGQFKVVWQCEINEYASKVLKKHWPYVPNIGNITEVEWNEIERPDMLVGGFPCQDISIAGKGGGIEGERSGLWWEFQKAIGILRPNLVLVENVPMLTYRGLDAVTASLTELGYDTEWNIVSARYIGANHLRRRMFVISHPTSERLEGEESEGQPRKHNRLSSKCSSQREVPNTHVDQTEPEGSSREQLQERGPEEDLVPISKGIGAGSGDVRWDRFNEHDQPIIRGWEDLGGREGFDDSRKWWQTEPNVDRVVDGVPNRVDRLKCLGNAVVPQVGYYLGRCIIDKLE